MKLLDHLNISKQCRELGVGVWSCPQFIFVIMGAVVVGAILATYIAAIKYTDPEVAVLIVVLLAVFLMVVAYVIVQAFERIVDARRQENVRSEELLRLKDQFVFIAAHELRTPVNAIQWTLEMLMKDAPERSAQEKKSFEILGKSSARLLNLVKDLLEVARIENKAVTVSRERIPLAGLAADILRELEGVSIEHQVTLQSTISQDIPDVLADTTRLKEVLVNLVSNGIKYNHSAGSVSVSAEVQGDEIVVHVTDTGSGLSPGDQPHVFEKFWRSADTYQVEGTGLGLFITKELIGLMGGRIWFESEKGKGTTFSFSLPCAAT